MVSTSSRTALSFLPGNQTRRDCGREGPSLVYPAPGGLGIRNLQGLDPSAAISTSPNRIRVFPQTAQHFDPRRKNGAALPRIAACAHAGNYQGSTIQSTNSKSIVRHCRPSQFCKHMDSP